MNLIRRHERIMQVLLDRKNATVSELSAMLRVTGKTIREDLSRLEEQGLLQRVHGGAVLAAEGAPPAAPSPLSAPPRCLEEKAEIARLALDYIEEDDIIALDGGSTMLEIARRLDNRPLTVVTNDVHIVSELVSRERIRLVVPGGYRVRNMLAGPEAVSYVKELNIEKAFLSAAAVHIEGGLSVYTADLIALKQALVSSSRMVIAACDHRKFGQTALRTFASLRDVDVLLTDGGLPAETLGQFRGAGIHIVAGNSSRHET